MAVLGRQRKNEDRMFSRLKVLQSGIFLCSTSLPSAPMLTRTWCPPAHSLGVGMPFPPLRNRSLGVSRAAVVSLCFLIPYCCEYQLSEQAFLSSHARYILSTTPYRYHYYRHHRPILLLLLLVYFPFDHRSPSPYPDWLCLSHLRASVLPIHHSSLPRLASEPSRSSTRRNFLLDV